MPDRSANEDNILNDQLADFADQVMDGQTTEVTATEKDGVLRSLQAVVLDIHQSISNQTPDPQTARRIQRNVIRAWLEDQDQESLISRIKNIFFPKNEWESTRQRRRRLAGQLALATIIVLAVMLPIVESTGSLAGAASGDIGLTTLISVLIILGALTAWVLWRGDL